MEEQPCSLLYHFHCYVNLQSPNPFNHSLSLSPPVADDRPGPIQRPHGWAEDLRLPFGLLAPHVPVWDCQVPYIHSLNFGQSKKQL